MSFYVLSSRRSAAGSDYRLAGTLEGEFWLCLFARVHRALLRRVGADLLVLQCRCACGVQSCCRLDLPTEQRGENFFARSMLSAGITKYQILFGMGRYGCWTALRFSGGSFSTPPVGPGVVWVVPGKRDGTDTLTTILIAMVQISGSDSYPVSALFPSPGRSLQ